MIIPAITLNFLHPWNSEVPETQEHFPATLVDAAKKRLIPPAKYQPCLFRSLRGKTLICRDSRIMDSG